MFKRFSGSKIPETLIFPALFLFFSVIYINFQTAGIYGGDSGDLVTAAYLKGVAHPPGYPLYTFFGWLLSKIPVSTVAWRVGLLSSIPAALSLSVLYLVTKRLVRDHLAALISVLILGFSYLFWLYAVVPEVFALHLLLVVLIFYFLLRFRERYEPKWLYIAVLLCGLTLSHHHTGLILYPVWIYLIWPGIKKLSFKKDVLKFLGLFLLGLVPYIYVVWAASGYPPINWEDPQSVNGLLRLFFRSIYGTFRSNPGAVNIFSDRLRLVFLGWENLLLDFTLAGIILATIGAIYNFLKNRKIFYALLLMLVISGPLFLFYSGFRYNFDFSLGTIERFLLLPYLAFSVWLAFGIHFLVSRISGLVNFKLRRLVLFGTYMLILIYPLTLLFINYQKLVPLRTDLTAEIFAEDLLSSVEDNSLLLLIDDTSIFNVEYLYYTKGGKNNWRGIKLISFGQIDFPFYRENLARLYPDLELDPNLSTDEYKTKLFALNSKFPIYTSFSDFNPGKDYVWVQQGLVAKLYPTDLAKSMSADTYIKLNETQFNKYRDPLSGALSKYLHLLPADILRIYGNSRAYAGNVFLKFSAYPLAEKYFREAVRLQPGNFKHAMNLAYSLIGQKKCAEAENILQQLFSLIPKNPDINILATQFYSNCENNEIKAKEFFNKYQENLEQTKTDLDQF